MKAADLVVVTLLALGCGASPDSASHDDPRDGGASADASTGADESRAHYWRCECDVQGSGRTALVLAHAAGSPLYADTCDVDDPSRRLEEEGDWYALARGDKHSCSCERSEDPSECTPCGHATHCEEKKRYQAMGRAVWPTSVAGVLWEAHCYVTMNGERGELFLYENDACSSRPEGPGEYLDWLCSGRFEEQAFDFSSKQALEGRSCECETTLPANALSCMSCDAESTCGTRVIGQPWYAPAP